MRKLLLFIAVAMVFTYVTTPPAYAYLDPGTGSAIVTTILGFFAAVVFTLRKFFYKFVSVFRKNDEPGGNSEP